MNLERREFYPNEYSFTWAWNVETPEETRVKETMIFQNMLGEELFGKKVWIVGQDESGEEYVRMNPGVTDENLKTLVKAARIRKRMSEEGKR